MPWNAHYYPASMKNLPPRVRAKAIEIANALLAEGMAEGRAIRIATARARQWGQPHRTRAAPRTSRRSRDHRVRGARR